VVIWAAAWVAWAVAWVAVLTKKDFATFALKYFSADGL
jgi:hypothetical protein